jgi:NADH-quinone oxidoreductase subunit E
VKITDELLSRLRAGMEEAAAPYGNRESALLAVLHAVQDTLGWIPPEAEEAVADFLGLGRNRIHEAVSFYSMFRTSPRGVWHVRVCGTLSCEICGSSGLVEAVRDILGLSAGQVTPDGMFSFEEVECLGACDLAPAVQVNDEPAQGPMTRESLSGLIKRLRGKGAGDGNA